MKAKKLLVVLCAAVMCLSLGILGACSHEHDWSAWKVTTAATCTEKGVETRTCDCGETETRDIDALGHDWGEWTLSADGSAYTRACQRDKCTATESNAAGSSAEMPVIADSEVKLGAAVISGGYVKITKDMTLNAQLMNAALEANRTAPKGDGTAEQADEAFVPAPIFIDLGGKTLTVSDEIDTSVIIAGGQQVTLSNGTLVANNRTGANANFNIQTGSSVTFEDLTVNATGSVLFPQGDAAEVNVINCDITTSGAYAIGTNAATTDNYNVVISVENSEINMSAADSCAVMINVEGTLNVSETTINAHRQGIIVRAGSATLTNVDVTAVLEDAYPQAATDTDRTSDPTKWASGNEVAYGALVVGNNNNGAYLDDATVVISGGSYICTTEDTGLENYTNAVFAVALNVNRTDAEITYATSITVSGDVEFDGNVINWQNTAEITGLDDSVTVLGQWNGEKFVKFDESSVAGKTYAFSEVTIRWKDGATDDEKQAFMEGKFPEEMTEEEFLKALATAFQEQFNMYEATFSFDKEKPGYVTAKLGEMNAETMPYVQDGDTITFAPEYEVPAALVLRVSDGSLHWDMGAMLGLTSEPITVESIWVFAL